MEITTASANPTRIHGIPSKPLDNPQRSKPIAPVDVEIARRLDPILRAIPSLTKSDAAPYPLLDAVFDYDARDGSDLASQLLFVAAEIHLTADERRTAEYLLRNRHDVLDHRRSTLALLLAARCAAEMDVRRVRQFEIPTTMPAMLALAASDLGSRDDDPSVGEAVAEFLSDALGRFPARPATKAHLLDAVTVAIELSQSHALNGGARPSVIAMRSSARPGSRLAAHLRTEIGNAVAARGLARMLVGPDRTPIEWSLLWWSAKRHSAPESVPLPIKTSWLRDLSLADSAIHQHERGRTTLQLFTASHLGVSDKPSDTGHLLFGT